MINSKPNWLGTVYNNVLYTNRKCKCCNVSLQGSMAHQQRWLWKQYCFNIFLAFIFGSPGGGGGTCPSAQCTVLATQMVPRRVCFAGCECEKNEVRRKAIPQDVSSVTGQRIWSLNGLKTLVSKIIIITIITIKICCDAIAKMLQMHCTQWCWRFIKQIKFATFVLNNFSDIFTFHCCVSPTFWRRVVMERVHLASVCVSAGTRERGWARSPAGSAASSTRTSTICPRRTPADTSDGSCRSLSSASCPSWAASWRCRCPRRDIGHCPRRSTTSNTTTSSVDVIWVDKTNETRQSLMTQSTIDVRTRTASSETSNWHDWHTV